MSKVLASASYSKMIEFIVLVVLILFVILLIFQFLGYTSIFLNLALLAALFFLITRDLKDKDNHKYYLASLLLTSIFFIFSAGIFKELLILTERMLLSPAVSAIIMVYLFANLTSFIRRCCHHIKRNYRRRE